MKDFRESIDEICAAAKSSYGFECVVREHCVTPDDEFHDVQVTVINPNIIEKEWEKLAAIEDRFIDLQLTHGRSILVCLQDRKNVEKFLPEYLSRDSMVMEASVPVGVSTSTAISTIDLFRLLARKSYVDPSHVTLTTRTFNAHFFEGKFDKPCSDSFNSSWNNGVTFEGHFFPTALEGREARDHMPTPLPVAEESRTPLLPLAA